MHLTLQPLADPQPPTQWQHSCALLCVHPYINVFQTDVIPFQGRLYLTPFVCKATPQMSNSCTVVEIFFQEGCKKSVQNFPQNLS